MFIILVLKYKPLVVERHSLMTFDELLQTIYGRGKEGYIVTLEDGTMNKYKTMWYFERHKTY